MPWRLTDDVREYARHARPLLGRHPVENSFADSWTAGTSVRAVTNRRERLYQLDRLLAGLLTGGPGAAGQFC